VKEQVRRTKRHLRTHVWYGRDRQLSASELTKTGNSSGEQIEVRSQSGAALWVKSKDFEEKSALPECQPGLQESMLRLSCESGESTLVVALDEAKKIAIVGDNWFVDGRKDGIFSFRVKFSEDVVSFTRYTDLSGYVFPSMGGELDRRTLLMSWSGIGGFHSFHCQLMPKRQF
jgi:hypothetical protein